MVLIFSIGASILPSSAVLRRKSLWAFPPSTSCIESLVTNEAGEFEATGLEFSIIAVISGWSQKSLGLNSSGATDCRVATKDLSVDN